MALLRKSVEVCSKLRTPLKGDTIWGHIACGVANHEGDEGVEAFFKLDPPFVVSSAFPHGFLPKPVVFEQEATREFANMQEYTEHKRMKKRKFVPASEYLECEAASNADAGKPFTETTAVHVSISRESGNALDEQLFSVSESWPNAEPLVMDLYISTRLPAERVDELLEWGFEFGYGADSSTGAGNIRVLPGLDHVRGKEPKLGRYLALGPFVGDDDVSALRSSTFVRKGKIGGALTSALSPYKKSVILFDEGATFFSERKKEHVGLLLHEMHSTTRYDICQSAFAPVIEV